MTSKYHRNAYRVTTAILALVMLRGGAAGLLRQHAAAAGMRRALAPAGARA